MAATSLDTLSLGSVETQELSDSREHISPEEFERERLTSMPLAIPDFDHQNESVRLQSQDSSQLGQFDNFLSASDDGDDYSNHSDHPGIADLMYWQT